MRELINWALRSDDGGSWEDDHPEGYCYPMYMIHQLKPDEEHYGNRIRERRPGAFERRIDLLNRLTGTPHDKDSVGVPASCASYLTTVISSELESYKEKKK